MKHYNKQRQLHRTDGPAVIYDNGHKEWFVDGLCHRTDGPAYESSSGHKEWFVNGKCHRTDGPAIEYINGDQEWHINGHELPDHDIPQTKEDWIIAILKYG